MSWPLVGPQTDVGKSHQRIKQKTNKIHWHFQQNVRHCLPVSCRHNVYNAFISSRLNYGSETYTNTTKNFIQPLIVNQNKILQILQFRNIKTPINNLYREFGALKLTDMHDFNICCIVHKLLYLRHLLPEAINDIFCRNEQIHHYNARNKKDLHPVQIKTKLSKKKNVFISRKELLEQIT